MGTCAIFLILVAISITAWPLSSLWRWQSDRLNLTHTTLSSARR
jgi:uncharacterized membrane protein